MLSSLEIQTQINRMFQVKGSYIHVMYSKYKLKHKNSPNCVKYVNILGHLSVAIVVFTTIYASDGWFEIYI